LDSALKTPPANAVGGRGPLSTSNCPPILKCDSHANQPGGGTSLRTSIDDLKEHKRAMIGRHTNSSDLKGFTQFLTTLVPLALLWWVAVASIAVSHWLTVAAILAISLFTLRAFVLMYECGHRSLFRRRSLNRSIGFVLGVVTGMPQYVWAQHHNFHHAHNGNWDKYRGPYTTLSTDEYAALTRVQQHLYRGKCSIGTAPFTGFIYLLFNPRLTWLMGTVGLLMHMLRRKIARPDVSLREHAASYRTHYWKSGKEYWHMFWNNVVLLSAWALLCWACGTAVFFIIYVLSVSIAGGAGIVLFTVQHNFEHAYASDDQHWDYDVGAIAGTSFLLLPGWLNWFTVNIGYHHIHHLSASIPNYCLIKCHREYQQLFPDVTRLKVSQVCGALKCILWDTRAQRIISVAEYGRQH
jgi:omega-6 fatty acid desaturase (delta-12 desaturase)